MSAPMLAEEIVHVILEMLPVKTLLRFRMACKSWDTLVISPKFKEDHHHRHTTNPPLLLKVHDRDSNSDPDLDTLQLSTYNTVEETLVETFSKNVTYPLRMQIFQLYPTCRGLVCIKSTHLDSIIICNPSTQELEHLPRPEGYTRSIGFGCGQLFRHKKRFCCDVLTIGSSQWREVSVDPYHTDRHDWGLEPAPFLNGALHFLPLGRDSNQEDDCISVFDVETEVYSKLSLPDQDLEEFSERILTELQGSLCLTVASEFNESGQYTSPVELWILKNYYNAEWVKVYKIYAISGYGWIVPPGIVRDEIILMRVPWMEGNELIIIVPKAILLEGIWT